MKSFNAEMIRAITPIVLTVSGAVIGLFVVINERIDPQIATAAFGLAGTAIAGAAGLAQPNKGEPNAATKQDEPDASGHSLNQIPEQ